MVIGLFLSLKVNSGHFDLFWKLSCPKFNIKNKCARLRICDSQDDDKLRWEIREIIIRQ